MRKKNPYKLSNHKPRIELVMHHDTAEKVIGKRDKKWHFTTFMVNGKDLPKLFPLNAGGNQ